MCRPQVRQLVWGAARATRVKAGAARRQCVGAWRSERVQRAGTEEAGAYSYSVPSCSIRTHTQVQLKIMNAPLPLQRWESPHDAMMGVPQCPDARAGWVAFGWRALLSGKRDLHFK